MENTLENITHRSENLLCHTYRRYPLYIIKAYGSKLIDIHGKEYIDLLSGIAVTSLGHCHKELSEIIVKQANKLIHVSNFFYQEEQLQLAEQLVSTGHFTKAFFCNSGAEANEASIKIARRYMQRVKNCMASEIITLTGAFHGRTLATLAATGKKELQDGFAPLPEGFKQVAWGDLHALESAITKKTAAILLEVIQGEGGVRPITKEYALGIKNLCSKHNIILIIDEVQTGLCRTGNFWSFQNFDLKPDIISCAKALANGLPIGAMLTTDEIAQAFIVGSHGTTFGGNALTCAVACKTLEIMQRDNLAERAELLGQKYIKILKQIAVHHPDKIQEVQGKGLMIGIVLKFAGKGICEQLLQQGFVLNVTQDNILRLLPALTINEHDLETFIQVFKHILERYVLE